MEESEEINNAAKKKAPPPPISQPPASLSRKFGNSNLMGISKSDVPLPPQMKYKFSAPSDNLPPMPPVLLPEFVQPPTSTPFSPSPVVKTFQRPRTSYSSISGVTQSDLVSKKGVKIAFLNRLKSYITDNASCDDQWTTLEVCQQLIKPWTEISKCSFEETMLRHYRIVAHPVLGMTYDDCFTSDANVFVSHAWSERFVDLVNILEAHCEEQHTKYLRRRSAHLINGSTETFGTRDANDGYSTKATNFWLDLFMVNQWNTAKLDKTWSIKFLSVIKEIGHTMIIVSRWDGKRKLLPLTRCWCLYEMLCTINANVRLTIQMPLGPRAELRDALLSAQADAVINMLCSVVVQTSNASFRHDKAVLMDLFQCSDGGLATANQRLNEWIRRWLFDLMSVDPIGQLADGTIDPTFDADTSLSVSEDTQSGRSRQTQEQSGKQKAQGHSPLEHCESGQSTVFQYLPQEETDLQTRLLNVARDVMMDDGRSSSPMANAAIGSNLAAYGSPSELRGAILGNSVHSRTNDALSVTLSDWSRNCESSSQAQYKGLKDAGGVSVLPVENSPSLGRGSVMGRRGNNDEVHGLDARNATRDLSGGPQHIRRASTPGTSYGTHEPHTIDGKTSLLGASRGFMESPPQLGNGNIPSDSPLSYVSGDAMMKGNAGKRRSGFSAYFASRSSMDQIGARRTSMPGGGGDFTDECSYTEEGSQTNDFLSVGRHRVSGKSGSAVRRESRYSEDDTFSLVSDLTMGSDLASCRSDFGGKKTGRNSIVSGSWKTPLSALGEEDELEEEGEGEGELDGDERNAVGKRLEGKKKVADPHQRKGNDDSGKKKKGASAEDGLKAAGGHHDEEEGSVASHHSRWSISLMDKIRRSSIAVKRSNPGDPQAKSSPHNDHHENATGWRWFIDRMSSCVRVDRSAHGGDEVLPTLRRVARSKAPMSIDDIVDDGRSVLSGKSTTVGTANEAFGKKAGGSKSANHQNDGTLSTCSGPSVDGSAVQQGGGSVHNKAERKKAKQELECILKSISVIDRVAHADRVEELFCSALSIAERSLGRDDPTTVCILEDAVKMALAMGELEEAAVMYKRLMSSYTKTRGAMHADTLRVSTSLGEVFRITGRKKQAEVLYVRALKGYMSLLGAEAPETLEVVENIAVLLMDSGQTGKAIKAYKRALSGYEKTLGAQHHTTLNVGAAIGEVYMKIGKFSEARGYLQKSFAGFVQTLGPDNLETLLVGHNLALVYASCKKYDRAEAIFQVVLEGRTTVQGEDDPATLDTAFEFAMLMRLMKKYDDAEKLLRTVLQHRRNVFGTEHEETKNTYEVLMSVVREAAEHQMEDDSLALQSSMMNDG